EEDGTLPDIRIVFGDAAGNEGRQGMLRFYDADILLFPVISDHGTVWVSTADRLQEWLNAECAVRSSIQEEKVVVLKGLPMDLPVNLGWLLLEADAAAHVNVPARPELPFVTRLVVVSDKLFHHLVNDNLEVRTSVEIDDQTGAAKSGALFTYEAIPRGTVLGFEVAIDARRGDGISREEVLRLLQQAFQGLKSLGIGGMGTRGFGRIEILSPQQEVAR
ncbi:MAG: hypothetical protein K6T59_17115, partial [Bryobacteraceae bacterium]|nr:hypothetical protein [Bryobacteraceae bacterium]